MNRKRKQDDKPGPATDPPKPVKAVAVDPNDEGWDDDGLTPRQRLFVDAYYGRAGGNAARAHELAGYEAANANSRNAGASQLLSKINVQRALARKSAERFGTEQDIILSIAEIAKGNAAALVELTEGEDGKPASLTVSLKAAVENGAMGLIQSIQAAPDGWKIKLYDRLKALELLARIRGMLMDRYDVTSGGEKIVKMLHGVSMDDLTPPEQRGSNGNGNGHAKANNPKARR
jgi:phage terminase small subunit